MDLDSTLDAIDAAAVHHCGQCDAVLGPDAPSKYWCNDDCQYEWNYARSKPLVGYREPSDLPEHVFNQHEQYSPETIPGPVVQPCDGDLLLVGMAAADWDQTRVIYDAFRRHMPEGWGSGRWSGPESGATWSVVGESEREFTIELRPGTSRLDAALETARFRLVAWQRQVLNQVYGTRHGPDIARVIEDAAVGPNVAQRALEARRNRNTGPQQSRRAPRRIDPRRTR